MMLALIEQDKVEQGKTAKQTISAHTRQLETVETISGRNSGQAVRPKENTNEGPSYPKPQEGEEFKIKQEVTIGTR